VRGGKDVRGEAADLFVREAVDGEHGAALSARCRGDNNAQVPIISDGELIRRWTQPARLRSMQLLAKYLPASNPPMAPPELDYG
jgi:hypothetical protein